ncbi:hypothetical protein HKX48_004184 [Thoreauomyces humboldtii]|nr:hypothetical protein HKX48_004184 [Thoreauomyces humboldtii]
MLYRIVLVALAGSSALGQTVRPLPDFLPDSAHAQSTLYIDHVDAAEDPCLVNEGCLAGNGTRTILRFGSMVHNIGNGDAYLGRPPANRTDPNNPVYWHWDTCHEHWHFTAYANYKLLSADRSRVILLGHKNGFCLEDLGCTNPNTDPYYNCMNQGISVGCYDLYDETLPCQWIDVTDLHLEPGYTPQTEYTLEVAINEQGFFPESNTNNNVATASVIIANVPAYTGPTLAQVRNMGAPNGPGLANSGTGGALTGLGGPFGTGFPGGAAAMGGDGTGAEEYGLALVQKCLQAEERTAELEQMVGAPLILYHTFDKVSNLREDEDEHASRALRRDTEFRALESRHSQLAAELHARDQEMDNLKKSLQKAMRERETRMSLEAKVDNLEASLSEAQSQAEGQRRENSKLRGDLSMLEMRLDMAERAAQSEKAVPVPAIPRAQDEAQVLFAVAAELQAANLKLRAELEAASEVQLANDRLKHDLEESEAILQQLRNDMSVIHNSPEGNSSPIDIDSPSPDFRRSVFGELEDMVRNTPPTRRWTSDNSMAGLDGRATSYQGPLTPAPSTTTDPPSMQSPLISGLLLQQLQDLTRLGTGLHTKLTTTDPQSLNKKLRREFDLDQLSKISQTVLENIRSDVSDLPGLFSTSGTTTSSSTSGNKPEVVSPSALFYNDIRLYILLPLVRLVQGLLEDLCRLKSTINDFALVYYEKISEKAAAGEMSSSGPSQSEPSCSTTSASTTPSALSPILRRALMRPQRPQPESKSPLLQRPPLPPLQQTRAPTSPIELRHRRKQNNVTSPLSPSSPVPMLRSATAPTDLFTSRLSLSLPSAQTVAGWFGSVSSSRRSRPPPSTSDVPASLPVSP